MRRHLSEMCELGGLAALSFGAYQLAPWLGWVVAGVAAILVGQAFEGRTP